MSMIVLHGYRYSVYTRIARMVLLEKGVSWKDKEVDPFDADMPESYLDLHPFRRVPVLKHRSFQIYETAAICRYVDAAFDGPCLTPDNAKAMARMAQVVSIVDSYGYRPMVRDVFGQTVFAPLMGQVPDETRIVTGLAASHPVLEALDKIASEGVVLGGNSFSLADCHLAPMIDCFVAAPAGAEALARFPALSDWWARIYGRPSLAATDPGRPT